MLWNSAFIYDWIKDGILLKIFKIYHFKFILWNSAFIYIGSRMDLIRNYWKCYPKFISHAFIFIHDCIENEISLESIKNIISNLYYEIIFLSMTGSRMEFYWKLLKYIDLNLYYEILLLPVIDQGWNFFIRKY